MATIFTTILATNSIAEIKRFSLFPIPQLQLSKCWLNPLQPNLSAERLVTEYAEVHRVHKEALQMRYCRTPKGHSSILMYYSISILQYLQAFYSITSILQYLQAFYSIYKHSTVSQAFYSIYCITL